MKKIMLLSLFLILLGSSPLLFSQEPIPPVQPGDVNEDNLVDIVDALLVSQHYVGLDPRGLVNTSVADVDNNGEIDIVDALLIARFYVGLIPRLPVGDYDFIIGIDEVFTITLSTNPSTGYGWFYTISDPNVVVLDSDAVTNCGSAPGSPCEHTFVFRGVGAGEARIDLEYYREFDDPIVVAGARTFAVRVTM
ncbi:MAG: protease inhibitor I42 family protein [Spirochaetales bacterium]|nr:protease inhibitor I42 family protein [Spirochaetales bacterium]